MLVKIKGVTIFLNKKHIIKKLAYREIINHQSPSELKDDVIPTEYRNNTLNWEHVAYTVHRFSFSHTYIRTHRSCNIVIVGHLQTQLKDWAVW